MIKKYIFTHNRDYVPPEGYTVIQNGDSPLDHRMWSELAGYKLLYNRIESGEEGLSDNDWVCLNHDHRFLRPDYTNYVSVPASIRLGGSLWIHWTNFHFKDDLGLVEQALRDTYPTYGQMFFDILEGNIFTPYNMAHISVAGFKDYCTFLFRVLERFGELYGHTTYEDRLEYIKAHPERYTGGGHNNAPEYQCRIEGFAAERLSTFYFDLLSRQIPVYICRVELTNPGKWI